jgi:hypothetical protein
VALFVFTNSTKIEYRFWASSLADWILNLSSSASARLRSSSSAFLRAASASERLRSSTSAFLRAASASER